MNLRKRQHIMKSIYPYHRFWMSKMVYYWRKRIQIKKKNIVKMLKQDNAVLINIKRVAS